MSNYCPIPGASQPKGLVRLVNANRILQSVSLSDCAYEGEEYQAYRAGVEYVRGLIEDAKTFAPDILRPTAHWIKRGYVCGENEYECSACHETEWRTSEKRMKYCMFCGARMVNANA